MLLTRHAYRVAVVLVVASILVLAGCDTAPKTPTPNLQANKVSVDILAAHLRMEVVTISPVSALLRGRDGMTVRLFADPDGSAYINGRMLDYSSGTIYYDENLYIPEVLKDRIVDQVRKSRIRQVLNDAHDKPRPVSGRIIIDAGHGGHDPGNVAAGKSRPEKSFNLIMATQLAKRLKQRGITVIMTRDTDVFVDLDDRVAIANANSPDLFISIHADSTPNSSIAGHTVIVPARAGNYNQSLRAAKIISQKLTTANSDCYNIRKDSRGLRVLRKTTCPAVLVEVGFMSNPREAVVLFDSSHQQELADALADAVEEYLRQK